MHVPKTVGKLLVLHNRAHLPEHSSVVQGPSRTGLVDNKSARKESLQVLGYMDSA
jgi:hypothetical protein